MKRFIQAELLIVITLSLSALFSGCAYKEGWLYPPTQGYGAPVEKVALTQNEDSVVSDLLRELDSANYKQSVVVDDKLVLLARETANMLVQEQKDALDKDAESILFSRFGVYEYPRGITPMILPLYKRSLGKKDLENVVGLMMRGGANRVGAAVVSDGWFNKLYVVFTYSRKGLTLNPVPQFLPQGETIELSGVVVGSSEPKEILVASNKGLAMRSEVEVNAEQKSWHATTALPKSADNATFQIIAKDNMLLGKTLALFALSKEGAEPATSTPSAEPAKFPEERADQINFLLDKINQYRKGDGQPALSEKAELREPLLAIVEQTITNYKAKKVSDDMSETFNGLPEMARTIVVVSETESPDMLLSDVFDAMPRARHMILCPHLEGIEVGVKQFILDDSDPSKTGWVMAILVAGNPKMQQEMIIKKAIVLPPPPPPAVKESEVKPEEKPVPSEKSETSAEEMKKGAGTEVEEKKGAKEATPAEPKKEEVKKEEKKAEPKKEEAKKEEKKTEPKKEEVKKEEKKAEPKKEEAKKEEKKTDKKEEKKEEKKDDKKEEGKK